MCHTEELIGKAYMQFDAKMWQITTLWELLSEIHVNPM